LSSEDVVKDFQVLNAGVKEDKEEVDTSRQERSENRNIKQLRKDIVDFILIVQPDDSRQFNIVAEYDENKNFILNLEMIREFYTNTIEDTQLKTEHFSVDASIYPAKELRHRTMFNLKLKTSVNTQSPDANNALAVVNDFIDETTDVNVKAF